MWQTKAACRGLETSLFVDEDPRVLPVCRACPVRRDCLDYALETASPGIWGGTTTAERASQRTRVSQRETIADKVVVEWDTMEE